MITRKPFTEDYVPVLPWLGLMWWGMAAGQWVLKNKRRWLTVPMHRAPGRLLVFLGKNSLVYYVLHQPVMIGVMLALGWILTRTN